MVAFVFFMVAFVFLFTFFPCVVQSVSYLAYLSYLVLLSSLTWRFTFAGGPVSMSGDEPRSKAELAILAKGWLRYGEWELHGNHIVIT